MDTRERAILKCREGAELERTFLIGTAGLFDRKRMCSANAVQVSKAAIKRYTESIEIDPTFVDPYVLRAVARSRIGECQLALNDLDTALNLGPSIDQCAMLGSLHGEGGMRALEYALSRLEAEDELYSAVEELIQDKRATEDELNSD